LKNPENASLTRSPENTGALAEKLLGKYTAARAIPIRLNIPKRLAFLINNPSIKITSEKTKRIISG